MAEKKPTAGKPDESKKSPKGSKVGGVSAPQLTQSEIKDVSFPCGIHAHKKHQKLLTNFHDVCVITALASAEVRVGSIVKVVIGHNKGTLYGTITQDHRDLGDDIHQYLCTNLQIDADVGTKKTLLNENVTVTVTDPAGDTSTGPFQAFNVDIIP